jgi:hypothetical protein
MNPFSSGSRFSVEGLESRRLMSTVITADFNNDTRVDKAEVTSPTTITVSLQQSDGSYAVSAVLTTPKSRPVGSFLEARDLDGDGDLDIYTSGNISTNSWYTHRWLNNGNGTFGSITTDVFRIKPHSFDGF